jgi:predicted YcjX-like family ATPase
LICHTCSELNRDVFRRKKDFKHITTEVERINAEKALKEAESQILEHLMRSTESRLGYYRRRGKATAKEYIRRGYLSLAIDGAGAQASNYSPRYSTSEKNEPERHEMLKIKSIYIKVTTVKSYIRHSYHFTIRYMASVD